MPAAAGIIDEHRRGREHVWRLSASRLAEAQRHVDVIARGCEGCPPRLKALVEAKGFLDLGAKEWWT